MLNSQHANCRIRGQKEHGWTRWLLKVPSNPNYSMLLCCHILWLWKHLLFPTQQPRSSGFHLKAWQGHQKGRSTQVPLTPAWTAGAADCLLRKVLPWGNKPLPYNPLERCGCSASNILPHFTDDQKLSDAGTEFCFKGAKKPCLNNLALKGVAPPENGKKSQQQWDVMSQFLLQMTDHKDTLGTALLQLCYSSEPASAGPGGSTKSHQAMVYLASYLQLQGSSKIQL